MKHLVNNPVMAQWCRIIGAGTFISILGLAIMDPMKQAAGFNASCQEQQRPATLIVNNQSQSTQTCTIALSALE